MLIFNTLSTRWFSLLAASFYGLTGWFGKIHTCVIVSHPYTSSRSTKITKYVRNIQRKVAKSTFDFASFNQERLINIMNPFSRFDGLCVRHQLPPVMSKYWPTGQTPITSSLLTSLKKNILHYLVNSIYMYVIYVPDTYWKSVLVFENHHHSLHYSTRSDRLLIILNFMQMFYFKLSILTYNGRNTQGKIILFFLKRSWHTDI